MAEFNMLFWKLFALTSLAFMHLGCINGDPCTMKDMPGTQGNTRDYDDSKQGLKNWTECKQYCLNETACKAVEVKGNDCLVATHDIRKIANPGSTLSVKVCTATTTSAATTTTTSAATTTTTSGTTPQGSCSWSQQLDTAGSNPIVKFTLNSYNNCESACRLIVACVALSFDTSSNTCKLYTKDTTSVAAVGSILGQRHECSSGCCYYRSQDKTGGNDQALTLTVTLASCQEFCFKLEACKAISYSGSDCSIYDEVPQTAQRTGVTTSLKSCSGGGVPAGLRITKVCLTGSTIQPVLLVILLMAGSVVLMTYKL